MSDQYWSSNDKLFVNAKLEVLWYDLNFGSSPLQPLPMERRSGVVYDGPTGDKFKDYLSKMGFHVNNKGRVIVATAQQDNNTTSEAFHHFLLDKVVPLLPFGFRNQPLPRWKEVSELETLLRNTKAELAKKNEELNESQRLLNSIRVESQKRHLIDGTAGNSCSPGDVKFPLSRSIQTGTNFLEFVYRINRTFVNRAGKYLKFEFTGTKFSGNLLSMDSVFRYYDKNCHLVWIFKKVQFDATEPPKPLVDRQVSLPGVSRHSLLDNTTRVIDQSLGEFSAFTWNDFCFIGKITEVSDETFRDNALVTIFFEQSNHGENCYVDSLATTFFVLDGQSHRWENVDKVAPRFV